MNSDVAQGYLEFAKGLAQEAGVIMKRYFRADDISTIWKEDNTPLTIADTTINHLVIDRVKKVYSTHGVIGEEESYEPGREFVWVVDPIDGTIPYSLGMPVSTFCLALVYKGVVQISVVYEPFQDRMFSAIKSGGAFLNSSHQLKVSAAKDFKNNYFFGSLWAQKGQLDVKNVVTELQRRGGKAIGLPSYAYVAVLIATGDLLAAFLNFGSPWDAAAVAHIVEEAGGKATDLLGKPRKYNEWGEGILLTNGLVHDEILRLISNADTRY